MLVCVGRGETLDGVELLAAGRCVPGVSCVSSLSTALSPSPPGSLATSAPPMTRPHRTGSPGLLPSAAGPCLGEAGAGARHLHIVPAAARTRRPLTPQSPSCSRTASTQSPLCYNSFYISFCFRVFEECFGEFKIIENCQDLHTKWNTTTVNLKIQT